MTNSNELPLRIKENDLLYRRIIPICKIRDKSHSNSGAKRTAIPEQIAQ